MNVNSNDDFVESYSVAFKKWRGFMQELPVKLQNRFNHAFASDTYQDLKAHNTAVFVLFGHECKILLFTNLEKYFLSYEIRYANGSHIEKCFESDPELVFKTSDQPNSELVISKENAEAYERLFDTLCDEIRKCKGKRELLVA